MTTPTIDAVRVHEQRGGRWRCTPPLVDTPTGPRQPEAREVCLTVETPRVGASFIRWGVGASLADVINDDDNRHLRLNEATWEAI